MRRAASVSSSNRTGASIDLEAEAVIAIDEAMPAGAGTGDSEVA